MVAKSGHGVTGLRTEHLRIVQTVATRRMAEILVPAVVVGDRNHDVGMTPAVVPAWLSSRPAFRAGHPQTLGGRQSRDAACRASRLRRPASYETARAA
jgi:hypothetical protein